MKFLLRFLINFFDKIYRRILNIYSKFYCKVIFYLYNINYKKFTVYGKPFFRIAQTSKVFFGDNVTFTSGKNFNVIGGDIRLNILVGEGASLIFGDNIGISNSTFVCRKSITIEDNVLVGGGCIFYDTDFHTIHGEKRIKYFIDKEIDKDAISKDIHISKGVWIGGHCIILKGVRIGENSIIAAGSVISKSIPPNQIWGGNPITFIKNIE